MMELLLECGKGFLLGFLIGGGFGYIGLVAPAPQSVASVITILGMTLGYLAFAKVK